MRINAYILAADPAWIEASVKSYYELVGRIVVSYDRDGRGWTGEPIATEASVARLRAIDRDGKMVFSAGEFHRPEHKPMENDTHQRQTALDAASAGADWVLQIDTDEVMGDARTFAECVAAADAAGAAAMTYPSRWLYCRTRAGFLEECRRGWRVATSYPGPMAVRAGGRLQLARRMEGTLYHVDLSDRVTSGAIRRGQRVDRRIEPGQCIFHFSWVRDEEWLRNKFKTWGHAHDRDWNPVVAKWMRARRHPWIASVLSQFERGPEKRHLRVARLPAGLLGGGMEWGTADDEVVGNGAAAEYSATRQACSKTS